MAKYQIQGVHNSKLPSHPQLPKVSVGPGVDHEREIRGWLTLKGIYHKNARLIR